MPAHHHAVNDMQSIEGDNVCLVTCDGGGLVKTWNNELEPVQSFDMCKLGMPLPIQRSVRSVSISKDASKILVCTKCSSVYEIVTSSNTSTQLFSGHHTFGVCGLASNPADPEIFATAGDDGTLRIWHCAQKHMLKAAISMLFKGSCVVSRRI